MGRQGADAQVLVPHDLSADEGVARGLPWPPARLFRTVEVDLRRPGKTCAAQGLDDAPSAVREGPTYVALSSERLDLKASPEVRACPGGHLGTALRAGDEGVGFRSVVRTTSPGLRKADARRRSAVGLPPE